MLVLLGVVTASTKISTLAFGGHPSMSYFIKIVLLGSCTLLTACCIKKKIYTKL